TTEESPIKHKTKSMLKLAVAAMLLFAATPLHAATQLHVGESVHKLGFAIAGEAPLPPLDRKDLPAVAVGDGATIFSLDLYFGADTHPVAGIAPQIHFNSNKIEIIDISKILPAGLGMPDKDTFRGRIRRYQPDPPLPAITIAGVSVTDDTDMSLSLAWMDVSEISGVAKATVDAPVHIITIQFQWKAGATGNSHIGITQSAFGNAHEFLAENILVRGPAVARITAQSANIDVTAGPDQFFNVQCALTRTFPAETTCALARADAQVLRSTTIPAIKGATIVIPPNETSGLLEFRIIPSVSDNGRTLNIALRSAIAGGTSLARDLNPAQIPLMSPGLMISKLRIVTIEGETEAEEFSVKLATRLANEHVVVNVVSNDTSEATLAPASLTFTASNWDEAQVVSVTAKDDELVDGDKPYKIGLAVDTGKTGAMHYHAINTYVHGITKDNDKADPVLTAEPKILLAKGEQPIVITAALEGGGVFAFDAWIALRKAGGSATEGTHYAPFTLPEYIKIPAGETSTSATFMLTITDNAEKTIVIAAEFLSMEISISNLTLPIGTFSWDVDSNGRITAQDGLMIARYLLGVTEGQALVAGLSGAQPADVAAHIERGMGVLDVSGNDSANPDGTDGILISRYFLGLRGDVLTDNFSDSDIDAATVERNIRRFLP
ncbi:MAG: hypothetical protein OD918_04375, partial [Gammaproteobacteria bacterium]